jgi:hypothetical protein
MMEPKKEKSSKKERNGGLWKLTPLMEIRPERGFPQRLGKHNPLSTVSTRPYGDDLYFVLQSGHFTCYKKRTSSRANNRKRLDRCQSTIEMSPLLAQ